MPKTLFVVVKLRAADFDRFAVHQCKKHKLKSIISIMDILKATRQGQSFHGHVAETIIKDSKDKIWKVVTLKRYSGNLATTAQRLEKWQDTDRHGVSVAEYSHDSPRKTLVDVKVRVTAKAVKLQHEAGLKIFEEQDNESNNKSASKEAV
jgi:hypothetical protein